MTTGNTNQLKTNQRVTNATIFAKLEEMDKRLIAVEATVTETHDHTIRCDERWKAHDKVHDDISGEIRKWSGIAGVGGAIAAVLAGLGIKQP